jgi:hypothetical protein
LSTPLFTTPNEPWPNFSPSVSVLSSTRKCRGNDARNVKDDELIAMTGHSASNSGRRKGERQLQTQDQPVADVLNHGGKNKRRCRQDQKDIETTCERRSGNSNGSRGNVA